MLESPDILAATFWTEAIAEERNAIMLHIQTSTSKCHQVMETDSTPAPPPPLITLPQSKIISFNIGQEDKFQNEISNIIEC